METVESTPISTETAPAAEVMPENMTGEQAKAWVESQKQKSTTKNTAKKGADPYFADKPKAESSEQTVKEAVAEAKRRLKIDDQEVDEDEVIKTYKERKGHQQAANKALQEGRLLRKQAEEFVSMLKDQDKFWEVAKKLGHDPRGLSEKLLVSHIEEEMMDPREKELKEATRKLRAYEEMEKRQKEEVQSRQMEEMKKRFADDYTKQFTQALAETNLPATKGTVAEMAKYIARAAELDFKMTAKEAAQLVREDIIEAQRRLIGDSDGETLIKLLGEDVANKVRKWDTSRLRDPNPARVPVEDQGKPREKRVAHKRMNPKEWREFNRR